MSTDDEALAILRLAWRVDALDKWRETVDHRLAANEEGLRKVIQTDEIAEAVALRVRQDRGIALTVGQKIGGFLLGFALVADVILRASGVYS